MMNIKNNMHIIKNICCVIYKDNLIFSSLIQLEQQRLYSGNDVLKEGTELWCYESNISLSSVQ